MQRALRQEHLQVLDLTNERKSNIQLQAGWAGGEWATTIAETLAVLCDSKALKRLGLANPGATDPDVFRDISTFLFLAIAAAGQRAWSMALWSELAPQNWAQMLHSVGDVARQGLQRMKDDCATVQAAWDKVHEDGALEGRDVDRQVG